MTTKSTSVSPDSSCLDSFIQTFPKISNASRSITKISIIFACISLSIALNVCAMMVVNNPNALTFADWNWQQLAFFGSYAATAVICSSTACFFSCIHSRILETKSLLTEIKDS